MSLSCQAQPSCPIFSPTPEAARSNWRSNSRLVMAVSEEEEEKNWDKIKGLFSSPINWEQMINHSLLFAATRASLTINPSKNLVSLGNLHVWPRCYWSLGTLMAATWSMGLSDGCSLRLCCMLMLAPGRGEEEGNII